MCDAVTIIGTRFFHFQMYSKDTDLTIESCLMLSLILLTKQIIRVLEKARNPHLNLSPMSSPYTEIKSFLQGNTVASRKKILPILLDFLKDWNLKTTEGDLQDLDLEEEFLQEFSDSQQCREDTVMEEDTCVPPTPMNSLAEGCPLDSGLPKINTDILVAKVSKIASEEEHEEQ